jgi:hypothetical protein
MATMMDGKQEEKQIFESGSSKVKAQIKSNGSLSDANAAASTKGVILTDSTVSRPVATDRAMRSYASLGRMNEDGTVNLDAFFGKKSRFDK